jgi:hypothetical protein
MNDGCRVGEEVRWVQSRHAQLEVHERCTGLSRTCRRTGRNAWTGSPGHAPHSPDPADTDRESSSLPRTWQPHGGPSRAAIRMCATAAAPVSQRGRRFSRAIYRGDRRLPDWNSTCEQARSQARVGWEGSARTVAGILNEHCPEPESRRNRLSASAAKGAPSPRRRASSEGSDRRRTIAAASPHCCQ